MEYTTGMKSQRKRNIMVVSNDELNWAYRATGKVTEYSTYKHNYAHGENKQLEAFIYLKEMVHSSRWFKAGDDSHETDTN